MNKIFYDSLQPLTLICTKMDAKQKCKCFSPTYNAFIRCLVYLYVIQLGHKHQVTRGKYCKGPKNSNYISFNEYIKANIKHLNSLVWFGMNPDLPLASILCRVTQQLIGGRVYKRQCS